MNRISIITVMVLLMLSNLFFNVDAESDYGEIIIWESDYYGKIFRHRVYGGGHPLAGFPTGDDAYEVGYADGNGNYFIESYELPWNDTLIIQPGITITFTEYWNDNFKIWGNIKAIGTEDQPIIFTSSTGKEESQPFQSWSGIDIIETEGNDEPEFSHCYIDHASIWSDRGIIIDNSYVDNSYGISVSGEDKWRAEIRNCGVSSHPEMSGGINGFHVSHCSEIEIINNQISGNSSHIYAQGENIICEGNRLSNNGGLIVTSGNVRNGIIRENEIIDSSLSIYGNFTIEENYISNPDGDAALNLNVRWNPRINNNIIIGNVELTGDSQERILDLKNNYWGTVDSEKINESITWNIFMDITPEYEYEPYLDEDMNMYVFHPPDDDQSEIDTKEIVIIASVIAIITIVLLIIILLIKRRKGIEDDYEEVTIIESSNNY